jgi:iron complex transport system substrate-binding protein
LTSQSSAATVAIEPLVPTLALAEERPVKSETVHRWLAWSVLVALVAGTVVLTVRLDRPGSPGDGPTTTVPETDGWPRPLVERFPDGRVSRRILLPRPPQRIVSLYVAADEILLDLVEPKRIAALSYLSRGPDSMIRNRLQGIEHFVGSDAESIVALRPDLCFLASFNREELRSLLIESGVPVFVFRSHGSFEDVRNNIRLAGRAVGAETKAERLIAAMDAKLEAVARRLPPREAWPSAMAYRPGGWVAGLGSTLTAVFEAAGIRNAVAEAGHEGFFKMDEEQVLALKPDYFVIALGSADMARQREWLRQNPALQPLRAIREKRFFEVEAALLASVSHYIADAVVVLARQAHPDRFRENAGE